ncbi:TSC22 domain family protein 1 [Trichinella murrelli]|uniref:TSC22 domain family protein 1 n=1 Tax=Trichinella murrelli TaxID=144512 RepID=A0A0V0TVZ8_9BILA|nr:TSC22 domain family protein 1 [Trichinella murrelli]
MMNQARMECAPRGVVERKKSVQIVSPKIETNTAPLRCVQSEDAIGKNFQVDVVDKDRKFVITCVDQTSGSDQDLTENGSSSNESGICNGSAEPGVMFAIGDQPLQRDNNGSKNLPAFVITTEVTPDSPRPSVGDVSTTLPTVSSRFHIVKLASDPFKRGRWLCKEFEGDDPSKKASSVLSTDTSKASTRKFTVLPVITDTGPTTTTGSNLITAEANSLTTVTEERTNDPHPVTTRTMADTEACTSPKQGEAGNSLLDTLLPGGQLNAEQMLLQGMNDSGISQAATGGTTSANGSGSSVVAIDNKIEQAMDLVKTHLLYAVREEVEVLRDRIAELEKKLSRLEVENKMLRETAPPDLVAQVCSGMPLSVNTTVANSSTSNANYASPSHCCSDDRCPNVDKLNSNCSSADR